MDTALSTAAETYVPSRRDEVEALITAALEVEILRAILRDLGVAA